MAETQTRPHRVEEHYGMPVFVELRELPELPDRASEVADQSVPEGKYFRAGAAKVDVTPTDLSNVKSLGGFLKLPPTGVHDRLFTRVVILDNGDDKIAIVSWDRINGASWEEVETVRKGIHDRTGIAEDHILINCTHTHAGCESNFAESAIEAAAKAWENMKDARIGIGSKMIYGIGSSRRLPDGTGLWGANQPNPEAVMDNECGVIRIEDYDRNIIAVISNYSSHPSVIAGDNSLISGDYAGIGTQEMEKRLGDDTVAMFLQGCAGDTGTHTFRDSRTIPEAEKLGKRFADAVLDILEHIDVVSWVPIAAKNRTIELPAKKYDPDKPTVPPITPETKSIRDEIQAIVINDAVIAALGSMEPYVELGLMIKDKSPFKHTFTLGYSNGPWLGYLPSPHGFAVKDPDAEGEARTHFSSEAPEFIVNEVLKLIQEVKQSLPA